MLSRAGSRGVIAAIVLAGCGRVGFDEVGVRGEDGGPIATDGARDGAPGTSDGGPDAGTDAASTVACAAGCSAAGFGPGSCVPSLATLFFSSGFESGVEVTVDGTDTQYWIDITGADRGFLWPSDLPWVGAEPPRMQTQLDTRAAPFTDYLRISLPPVSGPYGTTTRALFTEIVARQPMMLRPDNNRFQYNMAFSETVYPEVYLRMWYRPTPDLDARTGYMEFLQLSHASSYLVGFGLSQTPRRLVVYGQGAGWQVDATESFPLDRWTLVELFYRSSDADAVGHIQVIQNGTVVVDRMGATHPVGVLPTYFHIINHDVGETVLEAGPAPQTVDDLELYDRRPCPAGTACLGSELCGTGDVCACAL